MSTALIHAPPTSTGMRLYVSVDSVTVWLGNEIGCHHCRVVCGTRVGSETSAGILCCIVSGFRWGFSSAKLIIATENPRLLHFCDLKHMA